MTARPARSERHSRGNVTRYDRMRRERVAAAIEHARNVGLDPKAESEWVPVSLMFLDPAYQREPQPHRVAKMAAAFNPDALGVVYVSARDDGTYAVIDGGHRVALMRFIGWDDQAIPAYVYRGLSIEDEAELFAVMNRDRRQPTPYVLFRADVASNHPDATTLARVLSSLKIEATGGKSATNRLKALATARRVQDIVGIAPLRKALRTLVRAWPTEPDNLHGDVLEGLSFLYWSTPSIDEEDMRARLTTVTPAEVLAKSRLAKEVHPDMAKCATVAMVLLNVYNARRRDKRVPMFSDKQWPRMGATGVRHRITHGADD